MVDEDDDNVVDRGPPEDKRDHLNVAEHVGRRQRVDQFGGTAMGGPGRFRDTASGQAARGHRGQVAHPVLTHQRQRAQDRQGNGAGLARQIVDKRLDLVFHDVIRVMGVAGRVIGPTGDPDLPQ